MWRGKKVNIAQFLTQKIKKSHDFLRFNVLSTVQGEFICTEAIKQRPTAEEKNSTTRFFEKNSRKI